MRGYRWISRKRKRHDEKEGQGQVLSFRELKSYFDEKFQAVNKKFFVETKHLAKRLKIQRFHSYIIIHAFNVNLIEDMEVLIHLIQKGSISRATKAVKNMIEDL